MPATETRRKTKSRSRVKKISIDDAEKEKEAAVKAAIVKAKEEWDREQEEDGFEDDSYHEDKFGMETIGFDTKSDEEIREQNEQEAAFDLFDWINANYYSKGIPVIYQIKRNNEIQGQMEHPCSWSLIQEKFGGGFFQIVAKKAIDKEYIKSQRQLVRPPMINGKDKDKDPVIVQPPQPSMDMNQMFQGMMGMFTQMQEMVQKERSREDREEKRSSDTFNSTFLNIVQNQQQTTTDMMLKLAEMSNTTSKEQSNNFTKMIEKLDDKFSKLFEKLADNQNKSSEFGVKDILLMTQQAEDRGRSLMETVMELADAKAERLAEMEPDSKDSLLASLVKGFAPILTQANRSMQTANQSMPRGSLAPQQRIPQIPPQHQNPGVARASQNPGASSRQAVRQAPRQGREWSEENFSAGALGLATFSDNDVSAGSVSADNESNHEAVIPHNPNGVLEGHDFEEPKEVNRDANDLYENATMAQRTIAELAIPEIAKHIFDDSISPEASAEIVLLEVGSQGYSPEVVVKEFTFDFLLQIAKQFGIAEEKKTWFERFYAKIYDSAGDGTQREEESSLS